MRVVRSIEGLKADALSWAVRSSYLLIWLERNFQPSRVGMTSERFNSHPVSYRMVATTDRQCIALAEFGEVLARLGRGASA